MPQKLPTNEQTPLNGRHIGQLFSNCLVSFEAAPQLLLPARYTRSIGRLYMCIYMFAVTPELTRTGKCGAFPRNAEHRKCALK